MLVKFVLVLSALQCVSVTRASTAEGPEVTATLAYSEEIPHAAALTRPGDESTRAVRSEHQKAGETGSGATTEDSEQLLMTGDVILDHQDVEEKAPFVVQVKANSNNFVIIVALSMGAAVVVGFLLTGLIEWFRADLIAQFHVFRRWVLRAPRLPAPAVPVPVPAPAAPVAEVQEEQAVPLQQIVPDNDR